MHSFCQCSWTCPASTNMQFGAPSIGENLDHEDHTGYALDHTSDYGKPGPHRGAHSAAGETRTLSCLPNFELAPESDPRASLTSVRRHLPGTCLIFPFSCPVICPLTWFERSFTGIFANLGLVSVFATRSFQKPQPGAAAKMTLSGDFSQVSFDLPPGAWPEVGLVPTGPLEMTVFELPNSQRRHVVNAGALPLSLFGQQQVAGKAVYFGPEGIKVRKNNPVALSFPNDTLFPL